MNEILYMRRCIEIARHGLGKVQPNPLVGSVVVFADKIIGEGYHEAFGKSHAEVNAINSVQNKLLLRESSIYVSLEPCNHFGKTPPCTDLIIESKIPKVIIGCKDPFFKVNGTGIEKLKSAGIEVTVGVLENECKELNKRFFTYHQKQRPYIILKWAQSKDGFMAPLQPQEQVKISNKLSHILSHKWRTEEQAIMVGTNTAAIDNPQLTARHYFGKNPVRIILDSELKLKQSLNVFDGNTPTILFTSKEKKSFKNLEYITINFNENNLSQILQQLYSKEIQSVIIEGGPQLLNSFLKESLWDEAQIFCGSHNLNNGLKAPMLNNSVAGKVKLENDELIILRNKE